METKPNGGQEIMSAQAVTKFTEEQMIAMAQFIAELTRQGVVYTISSYTGYWEIAVTGF